MTAPTEPEAAEQPAEPEAAEQPVEQAADPRRWFSVRTLLILIGVLAAVFVAALVVVLVMLHQPDLPPAPIPSVPSA